MEVETQKVEKSDHQTIHHFGRPQVSLRRMGRTKFVSEQDKDGQMGSMPKVLYL